MNAERFGSAREMLQAALVALPTGPDLVWVDFPCEHHDYSSDFDRATSEEDKRWRSLGEVIIFFGLHCEFPFFFLIAILKASPGEESVVGLWRSNTDFIIFPTQGMLQSLQWGVFRVMPAIACVHASSVCVLSLAAYRARA